LVRALWDAHPVSPGHALVLPRRHVTAWFDATPDEQAALLAATDAVRHEIERHHTPDGYNLGVNVGEAAGQTVVHLHLHVIPRYLGDVPDPRGGVRHVIPHKANYLASPTREGAPHDRSIVRGGDDPLLPHLIAHLDRAVQVDIAVAFTLSSGVQLLEEHLRDVLARGGRVRILTGDYLGVTEPDALLRLLDLGQQPEIRVFESAGTSFHPKSYIVHCAGGTGTAFVGSSNLSRTALSQGVEWNYRVITSRDGLGFRDVCDAFEELFRHEQTRPLDADWIARYRQRRQRVIPVLAGVQPEPVLQLPLPHPVQQEALEQLAQTRREGNTAGLVVLATGLGKTWLSAFDTQQAAARRVLFVAHRDEILEQAMRTYRTIRPHALLGKYTGTEKSLDADVIFASIQTLGRQRHLDRFPPDLFDYIVVDEFHHAAASTYRGLLDHFTPRFLLGLTATPERTDGADLLAFCGENLVYRCDLVQGIRRGLLAPFDYYGVPDEVDYENIPWRSNRFDEEALTTAVATQSRAQNALDQLQRRGGTRTLAFCVSQRHADWMRQYFRQVGLRVAAVHSGEASDPRAHSLERLQRGELDVLFAVDMFNEGVDLPDVDTVLMMRPTESQILWLQQFGRGLRYREGKRLKVIDYIGNHRSFLLKPRTLFQIDGGDTEIAYALGLLDQGRGAELLPPGCSVTYDLEAKDILRSLLSPAAPRDALVAHYREFRDRTGVRPTASETFHDGLDPRAARPGYGSWFQFVRTMGDLTGAEDKTEVRLRSFLSALEITPMTRNYKMLVLLAMIAEGAFPGSIAIDRLAERVAVLARRSAVLRTELRDVLEDSAALIRLLEENPIAAWTAGRGTGGERFFTYDGARLTTTFSLPGALRNAAAALTRELAEWRLAVYIRRIGSVEGAPRILCNVSHTSGRPILFLPSRDRNPGIPEGWVEVTADGERYQANFVKIAVNVLAHSSTQHNVLPDLLRKWFGPNAGQPGTTHAVVFERTTGGYILSPVQETVERGPRLWTRYPRAEVPKLFGFQFKAFEAQSGVVSRPGLILLFVTLDKTGMQEAHRYTDTFLSPDEFRWQSQNRTRRDSPAGRAISGHTASGTTVHLFVRPAPKLGRTTQPFVYCGPLTFERWEGDHPITVWWRLEHPVPEHLWPQLRVSGR
jgi:superfamily II DNA or RNA helicase/diadenosine tetraphosphate (Ap4A) HIT family hydrolase